MTTLSDSTIFGSTPVTAAAGQACGLVMAIQAHGWSGIRAEVQSVSYYFGLDTGSGPYFPSCATSGETFYIGRLGGGTSENKTYFNTSTAQSATKTFAFWDLWGPGDTPSGYTNFEWGEQQASSFISSVKGEALVNGWTLFCDVESGNPGWGSNLTDNQDVLNGFLSYIISNAATILGVSTATAGVYISSSNWTSYFGTNSEFQVGYPYVQWLAGTRAGCYDCTEAESAYSTWSTNLGGYKTMIWQYLIYPSCSGSINPNNVDADITPYPGFLNNGYWTPTT